MNTHILKWFLKCSGRTVIKTVCKDFDEGWLIMKRILKLDDFFLRSSEILALTLKFIDN